MLKNFKNKKKKGFTLIELIIVIAIIAILAAVAIPKLSSVRQSANLKADIANAKTIANATSALLAEGTVTESDTAIDLSITTGDAGKIREYLQTVPSPKAGTTGDKFIVKTKNGDVVVYIAADTKTETLTEAKQVYPEPTVTGTKGTNIWYPDNGVAK